MQFFKVVNRLLVISFFVHGSANGQVVEWTEHVGGAERNDLNSISVDSNGYVYVAGTTQDTTIFFTQNGEPTTVASTNVVNGLLAKYSSSGDLLWSFVLSETGSVIPVSVSADSLGNVLLSGNFSGTVDFDPGQGEESITSNGINDGFLAKYNSDGEFIWVWTYGGTESDGAGKNCSDSEGNVYVTGGFTDTLSFGSSTGIATIGIPERNNFFLAKLTSSGQLNWIFTPGYGTTTDLKLTPNGNLVLAGKYCDSIDFDPGPGLEYYHIEYLGQACQSFVVEYDLDGVFNWVNTFGTMNYHNPPRMAVAPNGSIYVTGYSYFTESSPSTHHCYVIKFDEQGQQVWAKWIYSQAAAIGKSIVADNDRIVIAVQGIITSDFDPGPLEFNLTTSLGFDPFLCEWSTDGDLIRVNQFETNNEGYPNDVFLDKNGFAYMAGSFIGNINLSTNEQSQIFGSTGWFDSFLMKLDLNTWTDSPSNTALAEWNIYPNPTSGEIELIANEPFEDLTVNIFNSNGQLVSSEFYDSSPIIRIKIIAAPGIYLVQLSDEYGSSKSFKLLKQ